MVRKSNLITGVIDNHIFSVCLIINKIMNLQPTYEPKQIKEHEPHDDLQRTYCEELLLKFIKKYLRKNFDMKNVFVTIRKKLNKQQKITQRQLQVLLPFLERERELKTFDRDAIFIYFSPIICIKQDKVKVPTLEDFFD